MRMILEAERELQRQLWRAGTLQVLLKNEFGKVREVIPQWLELVCTGGVAPDATISLLIDKRLAEVPGLRAAIIEDWC